MALLAALALSSQQITLQADPNLLGSRVMEAYRTVVSPEVQEQEKAAWDAMKATESVYRKNIPYMVGIRAHSLIAPDEAMERLGNLPAQIVGRTTWAIRPGVQEDKPLQTLPNINDISDAVGMGTQRLEMEVSPSLVETPEGLVKYLAEMVRHHKLALAKLTPEEQKFCFDRVPVMIGSFWPQFNYNDAGKAIIAEDKKLLDASLKVEWMHFQHIVRMLNGISVQAILKKNPRLLSSEGPKVPGVYGQVLWSKNTPNGWIIIGGPGPNVYEPTEPVAMILDAGGKDSYAGPMIGNTSLEHGVSLIFDESGDDLYDLPAFGLACGRMGVSMVKDAAGDDTYLAKMGGGGTGFMGIGILHDRTGNDSYTGERFSLGSAMAGIGWLQDDNGNDRYVADLLAIGVGGPRGGGVVLDQKGDDFTRLGFVHASGYNGSDAPDGNPNNPNFQYEAWGMGMGIGRRVWPIPSWDEVGPYTAAGGIGILFNAEGNDLYESSNFSLGCGYFFGVGAFVDWDGNDHYKAARYGMASGAHQAMGFFADRKGNDLYTSTGPTYNCGCSWDQSIFMFADFEGNDTYDLRRAAGPGRGDIGAWGFGLDLAGNDTYRLSSLPGGTSRNGLGAFLDAAGQDTYEGGGVGEEAPANGRKIKSGETGLFWDR